MTYDLDDRVRDPGLPTDVTLRTSTYRRRGVIATLLSAIGSWSANRRLDRAKRRYRSGHAPPIPEWLREDLGLPPLPPPIRTWWEDL